jgi:Dolichyl-phosphate-mannose-protein mannosyltransferase
MLDAVARSRFRLFLEAPSDRLDHSLRHGGLRHLRMVCAWTPSPILYTVTSILVFLAARALHGDRIGFWSAVMFTTLPAVAFSSLLVATDFPLSLFWTLALYSWIRPIDSCDKRFAVLIGASLGLGLLPKYGAIYFVVRVAIGAWSDLRLRRPRRRRAPHCLGDRRAQSALERKPRLRYLPHT